MMLPPRLSRPYWRIIIDLALSCDFRENRSSKLLNGYSIYLFLSVSILELAHETIFDHVEPTFCIRIS